MVAKEENRNGETKETERTGEKDRSIPWVGGAFSTRESSYYEAIRSL